MSTTIQFLNSNNKQITEQQANQLDRFSKNIFIDNVLKKKETYVDKELWGGKYYISDNENIIDVLNSINPALKWSIMSNKQIANGYTVWEARFYYENLQQEPKYSRVVSDNLGNHIATVMFDTFTNQAKGAYKVFYYGNKQIPWGDPGDLFPEDSDIAFSFSDDGTIKNITMMYNILNNEGSWRRLDRFLEDAGDFLEEIGMTQEQLYYFTHVEPVVPNF